MTERKKTDLPAKCKKESAKEAMRAARSAPGAAAGHTASADSWNVATMTHQPARNCRIRSAQFFRGFFDEVSHLSGMRDHRYVARLKNECLGAHPFRTVALKVDQQHVVLLAHDEPAGLVAPRRVGDRFVVRSGSEWPLQAVQQFDLIGRKVVGEVATKSFEGQRETIVAIRLDFSSAWRNGVVLPPSIECLARIRRRGRDVDETTDLELVARLGDHRASPRMPDEQYRSVLHHDRSPNCIDVVGE